MLNRDIVPPGTLGYFLTASSVDFNEWQSGSASALQKLPRLYDFCAHFGTAIDRLMLRRVESAMPDGVPFPLDDSRSG
jgi:hypothetical protein